MRRGNNRNSQQFDRVARNRDSRSDNDSQYGFDRPNRASARSDYGEYAYGGRLGDTGIEQESDWWDEATGAVSSWFDGEDERRTGRQSGRDYPGNGRNRQNLNTVAAHKVMTRDVATVYPNDSVQFAARIMRDEDCGALPVVNRRGQLIGMITDRDITVRLVAEGYDTAHELVKDCMTDEAFACHAEESVRDCMSVMSRHQIRRLPIIDDHDRVVGIVSQADLARWADNQRRSVKRAFTDMMDDISEPTDEAYS